MIYMSIMPTIILAACQGMISAGASLDSRSLTNNSLVVKNIGSMWIYLYNLNRLDILEEFNHIWISRSAGYSTYIMSCQWMDSNPGCRVWIKRSPWQTKLILMEGFCIIRLWPLDSTKMYRVPSTSYLYSIFTPNFLLDATRRIKQLMPSIYETDDKNKKRQCYGHPNWSNSRTNEDALTAYYSLL